RLASDLFGAGLAAGCGDGAAGRPDRPVGAHAGDAGHDAAPTECTEPPAPLAGDASAPAQADIDPADHESGTTVGFDLSCVDAAPAAFRTGVQSGAMTPSGALLWAHTTASDVVVRVFRDGPTAQEVILVHESTHEVGASGTVKVAVD